MRSQFLSTVIISSFLMGACTQPINTAQNLDYQNNGKMIKVKDQAVKGLTHDVLTYDIQSAGLAPKGHVNIWAEKLVNELVVQNDGLRSDQPLLVATPVMSTNFEHSNELSLQLQQGLQAAFHAHEFNLIDLNVSNSLRASEQGEFMLSRNWELLPTDLPVTHVLVSTLSLTNEGVLFNGRVVNVTNNRIVSAVQSYVTASSLSGYLQPSERIETRNGLLYRHENVGDTRYTVLGDK